MNKTKLTSAIQKYSLAGNCNSVMWDMKDNELSIQFMTEAKTLLGTLKYLGIDIDDGVFGVYDTDQLSKMLAPLDQEITAEYTTGFHGVDGVLFKDGSMEAHFLFADPTVIPNASSINSEPEYHLEFAVDEKFGSQFVKAKSALSDSEIFAFVPNGNSVDAVLNYSTHRTNRMVIPIPSITNTSLSDTIAFNAELMKEILNANKDFETGMIRVSSAGLMKIEFIGSYYSVVYYIVKMEI